MPACRKIKGERQARSFGTVAPDAVVWLCGGSPAKTLVAAMLLAVVVQSASVWFVRHQPWLGVAWQATSSGRIVVTAVAPRGPSAHILMPEDEVMALGGVRGSRMALRVDDLIEDPDELPRFSDFRMFMARQGRLYDMLGGPVVRVELADGRIVRVQPARTRPLSSLPGAYWVNHLFAWLTLLLSAGVWCLRRDSPATRLLLVSGVGLFVGASTAAVYIGREIALDAEVFRFLSFVNSVGNRVFAVAGLALLWCYPRLLGRWRWFAPIVALEALFVVNLAVQRVEISPHSFYADYLALALAAVVVGVASWRATRGNPLHRAVLKLLFFPIYMSVFLAMAVFVLPVVMLGRPLVGTSGSYMLLLVMYVGLALGVARHRLFDVERWWVQAWLWFAMGVAVVGVDLAVVSLLHLDGGPGLLASVLIVAWGYFPLRQWVWRRVFRHGDPALEAHVPALVSHFVRARESGDDGEDFWKRLLEEAFLPISSEWVDATHDSVELAEDGVRMRVPMPGGACCLEMRLPDRGRRLFDRRDVDLARGLLNIARKARAYQQAYALGMEEERRRIMRDLHDDVGGRLLALAETARADETRRLAGEALECLREVIYFSFEDDGALSLSDVLDHWRDRMRERLDMAGVRLDWEWDATSGCVTMPSADMLSLGRMLHEGVSNALAHARPTCVTVRGAVREDALCLDIANDGLGEERVEGPTGIAGGKGIHNIRQRAAEMHGRACAGREGDRFVVRIVIPLSHGRQGERASGEVARGSSSEVGHA